MTKPRPPPRVGLAGRPSASKILLRCRQGVLLVFAVAAALHVAEPAIAQTSAWPVDGLRVQLGASAETVQNAYGIAGPPRPMHKDKPTTKMLRAPVLGLSFFFEGNDCLSNIRMDAPFAGSVAGLKLGESLAKMKKLLGEPMRPPWSFNRQQAHIYPLTPAALARYDVSPNGGITSMFVMDNRNRALNPKASCDAIS